MPSCMRHIYIGRYHRLKVPHTNTPPRCPEADIPWPPAACAPWPDPTIVPINFQPFLIKEKPRETSQIGSRGI